MTKIGRVFRLGLLALALTFIGGIGGYLAHQYFQGAQQSLPAINGNALPNLQMPKAAEVGLSNGRNTAIVQAVKQVSPAVVGITARVYNRDIFNRKVLVSEGVGSGVIFDERGYIVTNNHVVENATNNEVMVSFADGSTVEGKVVGRDSQTDLAVVKVEKKGLPVAVFGDSDTIAVGEPAIAIGNPLGLEFQGTVTTGIISSISRTLNVQEQRFPLLQTDAAINPGNSGGALVNADGYVIGINSAKISHEGIEGIGFAIPINQARPILKSLIENGRVIRAYLGVWTADRETAAKYGYQFNQEGLLILRVANNGPLDKAGLRQGDILLSLDGTSVKNLMVLRALMDNHKPGDTLTLTYERNGTQREAKVTLATMVEE